MSVRPKIIGSKKKNPIEQYFIVVFVCEEEMWNEEDTRKHKHKYYFE